MTLKGPSLCRTKNGLTIAKFNGKTFRFGRADDPEARIRFTAFKARWEAAGRQLTPELLEHRKGRRGGSGGITVAVLVACYFDYLRTKHDARWLKNNLVRAELATHPLIELCGPNPARRFSPLDLQAVRRRMVDSGSLCRREINARVQTLKAVFRWAVANELVPPDLAHGLAAVDGLRKDDFGVREGREVRPVDRATVEATLPYLSKPVTALVELMWWSGARPSELFRLTSSDVDRSGDPWIVRLDRHKTAHRGKRRELSFGPEARAALAPLLVRPADRPLFSPREAVEEMRRRRRSERKTPLWASHVRRYEQQRQAKPQRAPGEVYDARVFRRAIQRAVAAANRDRTAPGLPSLPDWTPYQLRHSAATRIREQFGIEAVRVLLGHSSATMSEVYAEADLEAARRVMEQAG